jgi:hypothetical protein
LHGKKQGLQLKCKNKKIKTHSRPLEAQTKKRKNVRIRRLRERTKNEESMYPVGEDIVPTDSPGPHN